MFGLRLLTVCPPRANTNDTGFRVVRFGGFGVRSVGGAVSDAMDGHKKVSKDIDDVRDPGVFGCASDLLAQQRRTPGVLHCRYPAVHVLLLLKRGEPIPARFIVRGGFNRTGSTF